MVQLHALPYELSQTQISLCALCASVVNVTTSTANIAPSKTKRASTKFPPQRHRVHRERTETSELVSARFARKFPCS